jgi:hypothetical protein
MLTVDHTMEKTSPQLEDFNFSDETRVKIDDLLKKYTTHDIQDRKDFIDNLFGQVVCCFEYDLFDIPFELDLCQYMDSSNYAALFRNIADALKKDGKDVDFHSENIEIDIKKDYPFPKKGITVLYWNYMHYKFTVTANLAKNNRGPKRIELSMTIYYVKLQPIEEYENDSEDGPHTRNLSSRLHTLCILQNLHDRIKRLECSIGHSK